MAGAGWWWTQRAGGDVVQYRTAKIERGNLQATVSASGAVNPVTPGVGRNPGVGADPRPAGRFQFRGQGRPADRPDRSGNLRVPGAFGAGRRRGGPGGGADGPGVGRRRPGPGGAGPGRPERGAARLRAQGKPGEDAVHRAKRGRPRAGAGQHDDRGAQGDPGAGRCERGADQDAPAPMWRSARPRWRRPGVDLARTRITSPVNGIVIKRAIEKGPDRGGQPAVAGAVRDRAEPVGHAGRRQRRRKRCRTDPHRATGHVHGRCLSRPDL